MKYLKLTLLLGIMLLFLQESNSKRILAVEFFGSKSHVITYLSLLEELTRRGHEVVLLSPVEGLAKPGTVKEIFTFDAMETFKEINLTMIQMKEQDINMNPFTMLTELVPRYCSAMYDRPDVKALMEEPFDLVFVQPLFNDCSLGFVHKVMVKNKAPLILFTPTSAPAFVVSKTGGHHPSSFVSNLFLGFRDEMTLYERLVNTVTNLVFEVIFYFHYIPVMEKVYKDKLGWDMPSVNEVLGSASLTLANGHFSLSRPKPNLPNVVDVGGIHSRTAKPLPKDLEKFLSESGDEGFILFSLGTGLKSSEMSVEKRNIFLKIFSQLKQRVVWKYEDPESVKNVPANVRLMKWVPQQDLLGHKNCRLFITHCGLGGTEEAIYQGVPLLGMPFFGDQPLNAREAENHGYLYKIEWNDLSEKLLSDGINEVLKNPKYRENVQRLSKVFRDQIDDPLQRGIWWVEYVLRHNGAPQLQSAARKLNFFQYHSYDIYTILALIALLAVYIPYRILGFAWKKFCGGGASSKKHENGVSNGYAEKKRN